MTKREAGIRDDCPCCDGERWIWEHTYVNGVRHSDKVGCPLCTDWWKPDPDTLARKAIENGDET